MEQKRCCVICKQVISICDSGHLRRCMKKNNVKLSRDEVRLLQIRHDFPNFDCTGPNLKRLYIGNQYGLNDFRDEFGLAFKQTIFLLDYFGISKRGRVSSNNTSRKKEKSIATSLKKYGTRSPNQAPNVKEKKRITTMERYGVHNVALVPRFKAKQQATMLERYGQMNIRWLRADVETLQREMGKLHTHLRAWWKKMPKEDKQRRIDILHNGWKEWWGNLTPEEKAMYSVRRRNGYDSKLERKVGKALDELGIGYRHQCWINRRSYDYKLEKTMTLLEVNGDYWHCNPTLYSHDFVHPTSKKTAAEIWENDAQKQRNAEAYGYRVITLWENEINSQQRLGDFLLSKIDNIC